MMQQYSTEWMAQFVPEKSRVIDIGCGTGKLLATLEKQRCVSGQGIEMNQEKVSKAVQKGLSVIQGNADQDLSYYPNNGFDVAFLQESLQAMADPKHVLQQALRIAKKVVLVIPNFGHFRNRWYLMKHGRMPVTSALSYQWYETPNIHFCTIRDMVVLAEDLGCNIEKRFFVTKDNRLKPFRKYGGLNANMYGEKGVFILSA